jgi:hypothetical protein
MHQYKIIARILLILPLVNLAFALPIAKQETRQVCDDVVPDVAITISAKRSDEIEKRMYFERLSGKPDSDLAGLKGLQPEEPEHGSMDPPQMGTSEIQQVSPELSKSPSFDHYLASPASPASEASEASFDHYLASPESDAPIASADEYPVSTDSELGSSRSAASGGGRLTTSSLMEKSKSFLSKVVSKFKFSRRISGPGSVRDAVNAAQGLVDTGAYVLPPPPCHKRSNFMTSLSTMVRDIGKSLNVPPTPATRGVRHPAAGKPS